MKFSFRIIIEQKEYYLFLCFDLIVDVEKYNQLSPGDGYYYRDNENLDTFLIYIKYENDIEIDSNSLNICKF